MTATAHVLVGGLIAASTPNPILGISLAFASHPLLDMVPHWDLGWGWRKKTKIKLFIQASCDLALGFILAYFLFGRNVPFWYFLACILASVILDIAEIPYWFFNWKFGFFGWVYRFQSSIQGKLKAPWGLLTQAATIIVLFLLLDTLPKSF